MQFLTQLLYKFESLYRLQQSLQPDTPSLLPKQLFVKKSFFVFNNKKKQTSMIKTIKNI